jgi:hypothetical protein
MLAIRNAVIKDPQWVAVQEGDATMLPYIL